MNSITVYPAVPFLTTTLHGRNHWTLARFALLGALTLATSVWVPSADAGDTVDRTPVVRPQVLQAAPAGYRQLTIPAAYKGALTPRSRTVEFRLTYNSKPATLVVTMTETGMLVNAFVSGALPTERFTRGAPTASPGPAQRARIRSWDEFWSEFWKKRNECVKKYPNDQAKREKCIDDALVETLGELIV